MIRFTNNFKPRFTILVKVSVSICLILGFFSCLHKSRSKAQIIGVYKSYTKLSMASLFKKTYYSMGSQLEIKSDSTFEGETCGNFFSGTWEVRFDTLILYQKKNEYKNDSLRKTLPSIKLGIMKYNIENDLLVSKSSIRVNNKTYNSVEMLKKEK
jgi:hypothetical protein